MARGDREEGTSRSLRDRARQRATERRDGGRKLNIPDGTSFFKPEKDKKALLDIIPYIVTQKGLGYADPGEQWYERTFFSHWGVGGSNSSVICPSTFGKPCPICEYVATLKKQAKSPETDAIISQLRAKERQLFNVIDRKDPDKGIQLFEMSYFCFGKELDKELKDPDNEEFLGFAELKNGYTLKIRWDEEAQGKGKPYLKAGSITFVERDTPLKSSLAEEAIDLDKALIVPSYDELVRMFNGAEEEDEAEDKPARKNVDDDDDDEEDEDVPLPKKYKKPAPADDEDEEDDDDDDEEDEEKDEDDEDRPPHRPKRG